MSIEYTKLLTCWQKQQRFDAMATLGNADTLTFKARESAACRLEINVTNDLRDQAAAVNRVVVATTSFRWYQHSKGALSLVLADPGGTQYTMLPWTPGKPLRDGFSNLTVHVAGVGIPKIEMEWDV